ncbi:MAG: DNA-binding HxlR family transcriptional regulator [Bacteroidia bacterium]|jgi:DNA-binding HxlR family transcriptional regulator
MRELKDKMSKTKIDFNKRSTCPLNSWLELFGDKWTLLIIRDMTIFGKKHFKDFMQSEEKISTNILADRLKKLEENGIVQKDSNKTNKLLNDYNLTPRALSMAPVFEEICRWSQDNIENVREISNPDMAI